jgi:hypothetical protein
VDHSGQVAQCNIEPFAKKKIDAYDTDALKFLQMDGSQQQH